ncbi:hypothetical protein DIPPA_03254 [Diplonema papillatum]|nr:hypothetical protein DIPPA_03254 [Diplonema papillatum]
MDWCCAAGPSVRSRDVAAVDVAAAVAAAAVGRLVDDPGLHPARCASAFFFSAFARTSQRWRLPPPRARRCVARSCLARAFHFSPLCCHPRG